MKFSLAKADNYRCYCSHPDCQQNPEFFVKETKPGWKKKIKEGTIIGIIAIGSYEDNYCRECIDKLYHEFKSVFDSKLWILH